MTPDELQSLSNLVSLPVSPLPLVEDLNGFVEYLRKQRLSAAQLKLEKLNLEIYKTDLKTQRVELVSNHIEAAIEQGEAIISEQRQQEQDEVIRLTKVILQEANRLGVSTNSLPFLKDKSRAWLTAYIRKSWPQLEEEI